MREILQKSVLSLVALAAMTLILFIMAVTVAQYAGLDTGTGFLQYKQEYIGSRLWLDAFYIHVFTCFLCLLAGITQFMPWILQSHRGLHRNIGKFYIANILFVNVPAGMILALQANGGFSSRLAFTLLDLLWAGTTLMAWISIRKGDIERHRAYMIRSFALTLSAISFRLWKQVWLHTTTMELEMIYKIDAWLGFIPNILVAEILIRYRKKRSALERNGISQYNQDNDS